MALPPFPRIHRCGEGCNRVHGQGGAALHLSDHLRGPTAINHRVCLFTHRKSFMFSRFLRAAAAVFVHAHDSFFSAAVELRGPVGSPPPMYVLPSTAPRLPCTASAPGRRCMDLRLRCTTVRHGLVIVCRLQTHVCSLGSSDFCFSL